jgi:hypothetical protein
MMKLWKRVSEGSEDEVGVVWDSSVIVNTDNFPSTPCSMPIR